MTGMTAAERYDEAIREARFRGLRECLIIAIEAAVAEERARCAAIAGKKWISRETGRELLPQLVPLMIKRSIEAGWPGSLSPPANDPDSVGAEA